LQQQQRRSYSGRSRLQAGAPSTSIYAAHFAAAHAFDWASRRALAEIPVLLSIFYNLAPSTKNLLSRETFFAGEHLNYQNHFEDTPREAARVHTLAASLLLGTIFYELKFRCSLLVSGNFFRDFRENSSARFPRPGIPERFGKAA